MAILDNFEEYFEARFNVDTDLCHYCTNKAKYTDVAKLDESQFAVVGVCQCHFVQDVS
jgi:hypothetical protein